MSASPTLVPPVRTATPPFTDGTSHNHLIRRHTPTPSWQIYSCVTDIYTPKPDRLRDWISIPKSNGYEALHSTVMGPDGIWVEVQVRTERMDDIAERGFAAHWKYKEIQVVSIFFIIGNLHMVVKLENC